MAVKKQPKPAGAKKKRTGRPTGYKPEYADLARKFCLLGATDKQLAEFFEVNEDTIYEWKKRHPNFSESIREGKDRADAEIANSLYHRAKGYEHEAEEIKVVSEGNNLGSRIERVPVIKRYPPDTRAIQFWMTNRRRAKVEPGVWTERQEIDHTTKGEKLPTPHVYLPQDLPRDIVKLPSDEAPETP